LNNNQLQHIIRVQSKVANIKIAASENNTFENSWISSYDALYAHIINCIYHAQFTVPKRERNGTEEKSLQQNAHDESVIIAQSFNGRKL
jgi:hypothetical protein